jgi:stage II sporulation protein AA (anti-sigma F factor antagonist)
MEIAAREEKGVLYIALNGEIDEHSAAEARRKADEVIDENVQATSAVFELQRVSFMDSTGIGFLIGRYKKLRRYGIPAYIAQPNLII